MKWTPDKILQLINLVESKQLNNMEISKILNLTRSQVQSKLQYLGILNPVFHAGKHKHIRKQVMEFFQTHSAEETQERFNITSSEFKSILTVAYKMPEFNHLRKDNRRKDKWTISELKFLLKRAGVIGRKKIASELRRGGMHSIKDRINTINLNNTRYVNGLPERICNIIIPGIKGIKTKAGAPGPNGNCHIKIVPWVTLEKEVRYKKIDPQIKSAIKSMAKFQRWIYNKKNISLQIKKILKGNYEK